MLNRHILGMDSFLSTHSDLILPLEVPFLV